MLVTLEELPTGSAHTAGYTFVRYLRTQWHCKSSREYSQQYQYYQESYCLDPLVILLARWQIADPRCSKISVDTHNFS
jgi:hypothetical protein